MNSGNWRRIKNILWVFLRKYIIFLKWILTPLNFIFRGIIILRLKVLPTIFHWKMIGGNKQPSLITPLTSKNKFWFFFYLKIKMEWQETKTVPYISLLYSVRIDISFNGFNHCTKVLLMDHGPRKPKTCHQIINKTIINYNWRGRASLKLT